MVYPLPQRLKPLFFQTLNAALKPCSTQRLVPETRLLEEQIPIGKLTAGSLHSRDVKPLLEQIPPIGRNDKSLLEQIPPVGRNDKRSGGASVAPCSSYSVPALSLARQGRGTRRLELRAEGGASLAEFAVTLPILVVILYGIFDFGSALVLKQKLEHVAYEAARTAASQSTDDLSNAAAGTSGSVADLRDTVSQNLQSAGVNDCGLLGAAPTSSNSATSVFVYNVSGGGCPAPLILTIRRQQTTTVGGVYVMFSRITLQYAFQYHVAGILKVVAPGSSFPTSANLVVNASMKNLM